jgi:hypothetical protein
MRDMLHADGDTWLVTADQHDARRAVRTLVFHCVSNSQRPYRVLEVPAEVLPERQVDALSSAELAELFDRSHVMDYSHDVGASPESHGYGDPPLK